MPALKGVAKPLATNDEPDDDDDDDEDEDEEPKPEALKTVTSNDVGEQTHTKAG